MIEKDNILIEQYLNDVLSNEEREAFEERLKIDVEFNNEFLLENQLHSILNFNKSGAVNHSDKEFSKYKDALEEDDLIALKNTLVEQNANFNSKPKTVRKLWYYSAAASIIVLLSLNLFLNNIDSNSDLYYDNVGIDNLPSFATRGDNDSIQLKLINGERQFKKGNYQEALNILKPLLDTSNNEDLLFIYVGLAQTELDLYTESKHTFDTLEELRDNSFSANWYKALIFIKQEDIDSAIEQLNIILENPNSIYFAKASELYKNLK